MIILLSPSKSMNFRNPELSLSESSPQYLSEAHSIAKSLKSYNAKKLQSIMHMSDKVALATQGLYQEFALKSPKHVNPALWSYSGEAFNALDADSFSKSKAQYAHNHLRILSGLYGILRPFDLIQQYRLEMGAKLSVKTSKNLYSFWKQKITDDLKLSLKNQTNPFVVNLASNEYWKAIDSKELDCEIIHIDFKQKKGDKLTSIATFSKQARGLMARYLIVNKVKKADQIKDFKEADYKLHSSSHGNQYVFVR